MRRSFLLFMMICCCGYVSSANGQPLQDAALAAALKEKNFVFRVEWVVAMTGSRRQLTPTYGLPVTSDSIDCYLPFLGRLYTTPSPQDFRFMSIQFISRAFSYAATPAKRGSWDVTIRPRDTRDGEVLQLNVTRNGRATLFIRSAGRDPVSYEGTIERRAP